MVIAPLAHWHVWERKFIDEFRIPDAPVAQWATASRERERSRPPQEHCPWTDARRLIIIATGGRGHLAPPHIAESGNKWKKRERERPIAWRSDPTEGAPRSVWSTQTIAALPHAGAVHAHAVSARTPRWSVPARAPPRAPPPGSLAALSTHTPCPPSTYQRGRRRWSGPSAGPAARPAAQTRARPACAPRMSRMECQARALPARLPRSAPAALTAAVIPTSPSVRQAQS